MLPILASWLVEKGVFSSKAARAACVLVGVIYPAYATLKAMEKERREGMAKAMRKTQPEEHVAWYDIPKAQELAVPGTHKWLTYWTAYGSFHLAEILTDLLIWWLPYYYTVKLFMLFWMLLPNFKGSQKIYLYLLRPFFQRNHQVIDKWVEKAEHEVEHCVEDTIHQAERGARVARIIFQSECVKERTEQLLQSSTLRDMTPSHRVKAIRDVAAMGMHRVLGSVRGILSPRPDDAAADAAPAAE